MLGAQNMCWESEGQYTGEISPEMLQELGLDLVMVGHSERRHGFGESNEIENKKVKKNMALPPCLQSVKQRKKKSMAWL